MAWSDAARAAALEARRAHAKARGAKTSTVYNLPRYSSTAGQGLDALRSNLAQYVRRIRAGDKIIGMNTKQVMQSVAKAHRTKLAISKANREMTNNALNTWRSSSKRSY